MIDKSESESELTFRVQYILALKCGMRLCGDCVWKWKCKPRVYRAADVHPPF